jgi:hypothetical protein
MKFAIKKIINNLPIIFIYILCMTSPAFAILDATLVSDTIPSELHPGEIRRIEVTMQNTGDEAWVYTPFRLQSITTPEDRWGTTSYALDSDETINPGATKTFILYLEAPITPGNYESQWQMKDNNPPELLFGDIVLDNIWVEESVVPEWDAAIISHDLPTEMFPGEPRLVTVTVENTGAGDWTGDRFALTSYQNTPPLLWDTPLFFMLGEAETVDPGEQRTFTFLIKAPSPPAYPEGMYDCVWQMVHIHAYTYFGELLTQPVNVSSLITPELGASLQSHSIPSDMYPGDTQSATLTFQNTGTTTWDENNMRLYAPTSTFGSNRIYYLDSGETVEQGASKTFTIVLTAPGSEGTYDCEWFLQGVWNIDGANQFKPFGDAVSEPVNVDNGVTPFLNASVVSHTIPSQMTASEVVSVDVTYENTGSGIWDGSDPLWIRLRTQNSPTGLWGTYNVNLAGSDYIEPGQEKTFTFNLTAPATEDTYDCRWQLQKQWPGSTSLFGELVDVPVLVGAVAEICDDSLDNDGDSDIDCDDSDCDGELCDDADACTTGETCSGTVCGGGSAVDCDDGNICTDDSCNPASGCEYTNNTDPCDDGLFCNGDDTCSGGTCTHSGDPCTPQMCDEGSTSCVDCTLNEDCEDGISCTDDVCDIGTCTNTPNDANCPDDGFYCNGIEFCDTALDCTSTGDPCAPDPCDEGTDTCVALGDFDADGVPDLSDNCPQTPNGPLLGTCLYGLNEGTCMTNEECGLSGFCGMNQEDNYPGPDGNGLGDACECEGDFDCDGDVDGSDANLFKRDFGRSILKNPCPNCP